MELKLLGVHKIENQSKPKIILTYFLILNICMLFPDLLLQVFIYYYEKQLNDNIIRLVLRRL